YIVNVLFSIFCINYKIMNIYYTFGGFKMFKKIYTLFIFTMFALVLSACGAKNNEATGVAYGMTYKDYLTVATVEVKGDEVTSASLDEYYLPNTWAKVKTLETEAPADVIVSGNTWYGKFIKIGDKNF